MSKGGRQTQTQTQRVDVPDFLQPFIRQASGTGSAALRNLQSLAGGQLVAGLNPIQQQAIELAIARAGGAGGFLPTAQQTLLSAAQGQGINFLPAIARDEFGQALDAEFLPAESRAALAALGTGTPALPGTETLQQTAAGDFLMGGQGFDAAVEAAVRAARPGILSAFGSAGSGGGTGALANAAIGQSAVDAFARQFAQERANQLGAAGQLANLGLAGRQQQLGALGTLADVGRAEQALGLGAASTLADLASAERARQLNAALALPQIAQADISLFSGAGGQLQQQAQREIDAPIAMQQALLAAASGVPAALSPLFGSTATSEVQRRSSPLSTLLGAGLTAASLFGGGGLGSLFGGGALSGGLAGGFGGVLGGFAPMSTGALLSTTNPLAFFTAPIGAFGP